MFTVPLSNIAKKDALKVFFLEGEGKSKRETKANYLINKVSNCLVVLFKNNIVKTNKEEISSKTIKVYISNQIYFKI